MNKNIRVQEAQINHKLFAFLTDLLILLVSSLALYFIILYGIFATNFNYIDNKDRIVEIENSYNLNLEEGLDYTKYEEVLLDFYFNKYPNEIKEQFNTYYNKDYTITHVYNIVVLRLNNTPTYESYQNGYFAYVQDSSGNFNPDILAIKTEGSGKTYERNMRDIFYNSYTNLKDLLELNNEEYRNLVIKDFNSKAISRSVSFAISLLVFYFIIPLTNKYKATLGEKSYKLAHVNNKDGYLIKNNKAIIRPFIYYLIPFIAIVIGSKNSIIIVLLGYLFINFLLLIFSKNNLDFGDRILNMTTCSIEESLLFKNEKEEVEYFKTEEGKKIEDPEFLDRLSKMNDMKVYTSRDEELKK